MELTFIGTGSGKTSLNRNHTSIFIRTPKHSLLIDCGDGTSKALLQQKINYNEIDSIIITHYHADHFSGIASLITQMKISGRTKPLTIFTPESLMQNLNSFLRMCYLFDKALEFTINIVGYISGREYEIAANFKLTAKQNSHIINRYGFADSEKIVFVSFSILIVSNENSIAYTSDIRGGNDLQLFNEEKPDIIISEATHISLDEIYSSFMKSSANKLYLTHIDNDDEAKIAGWLGSVPGSEKIKLTHDGFTIKL